tara:strand:- start:454 stop:1266 length:813 start_codon:yes stop_codon:yes gene_type:complete
MKRNITSSQRRKIRRLVRETLLEQNMMIEQRELALREFEIQHSRMLEEGYSLAEANLLILEVDFVSALGFGGASGIKQQIVTSILQDFNIPTNTLSGKFLVNIIENIGINQVMALFGAGPSKCDAVVELLSKAAMETITEYGAAKLIAYVFEKTAGKTSTVASAEIEKAMNSFIGSVGVEIINDLIYQYFKAAMLDDLANKICNQGITDVVGSLKSIGSYEDKFKDVGKIIDVTPKTPQLPGGGSTIDMAKLVDKDMVGKLTTGISKALK